MADKPANPLTLYVEGEKVWESDFESDEVTEVGLSSGASAETFGITIGQNRLDLTVQRRDSRFSNFLDINDARTLRAQGDAAEKISQSEGVVDEGRKQQEEADRKAREEFEQAQKIAQADAEGSRSVQDLAASGDLSVDADLDTPENQVVTNSAAPANKDAQETADKVAEESTVKRATAKANK